MPRLPFRLLSPLAVCLALLPAAAHAQTQTATFTAAADTYVHAGYPAEAFGGQDLLFVVLGTPPNRSRLLVDFDLSSLAGATIESATLRLQMYQSGTASVPAYLSRISDAWTEGGATWDAQPATTSTLPQAQITKSTPTLTFDVTALVAEAAADPSTFHGIALASRETGASFTYAFASRERQAQAPTLEVTYTPAADVIGPLVSGLAVGEIGLTSAVVTLTTDEDADVTVDFGLDDTYGRSVSSTSTARAHRLTLFPLASSSTYHYRIRARDAVGNESTTPDGTFTTPESTTVFPAGTLVKIPDDRNPETAADSAVYYVGSDGKRHPFPNVRVYHSWYADFSSVQTITIAQMAAIPLGANVRFRPGTRLLKFETVPTVYAIARGGILHAIASEEIAAALFGNAWATLVDDITDVLFGNYLVGGTIATTADYDPTAERDAATTIDQDQGR